MANIIKTVSLIFFVLICLCSCSSPDKIHEPSLTKAPVSESNISTAKMEAVETASPSPTMVVTTAPSPSESPEATQTPMIIVNPDVSVPAVEEKDNKRYSADINKPEQNFTNFPDYIYEIDIRLVEYVGYEAFFDWLDETGYLSTALAFRTFFLIDDELYKTICKEETIDFQYVEDFYKSVYNRYLNKLFIAKTESEAEHGKKSADDIEASVLPEGYFSSYEAQYNGIKAGVTTAEQLLKQLGEPDSTQNIDDITYIYHYGGVKYYSSAISGLIKEIIITEQTETALPRDIKIGDTMSDVLGKIPVEYELSNGYGIVYGELTDARCLITGDNINYDTSQNESVYKMMYFNSETINPSMMLKFKDDVLYEITLAADYFFSQEAKYKGITINQTTSYELYEIHGEPENVMIRLDEPFFVYYYYDGVRYQTWPESDVIRGLNIIKNSDAATPRDIKIGDSYNNVISKFPYNYSPVKTNEYRFYGGNTLLGSGGFINNNSASSLLSIVVSSARNTEPYFMITFNNGVVSSMAFYNKYN